MNKLNKLILCFVMCIVCTIVGSTVAEPAPKGDTSRETLFFIAASGQDTPYGRETPEIVRLDIKADGQVQLHTVHKLNGQRLDFVTSSRDGTLLAIGIGREDNYEIGVIQADQADKIQIYRPKAFTGLGFGFVDDEQHLMRLLQEKGQRTRLWKVDPVSLREELADVISWRHVNRPELVTVTHKKIEFARQLSPSVTVADSVPDDVRAGDKLFYLGGSLDYAVFREYPLTGDDDHVKVWYLDRRSGQWQMLKFKGDRSEVSLLGPFIVGRVAWNFPEADYYGPVFTGEWIIQPIQGGDTRKLNLSPDSRLLIAREDFIIASSGNKLMRFQLPRDTSTGTVLIDNELVSALVSGFIGSTKTNE